MIRHEKAIVENRYKKNNHAISDICLSKVLHHKRFVNFYYSCFAAMYLQISQEKFKFRSYKHAVFVIILIDKFLKHLI